MRTGLHPANKMINRLYSKAKFPGDIVSTPSQRWSRDTEHNFDMTWHSDSNIFEPNLLQLPEDLLLLFPSKKLEWICNGTHVPANNTAMWIHMALISGSSQIDLGGDRRQQFSVNHLQKISSWLEGFFFFSWKPLSSGSFWHRRFMTWEEIHVIVLLEQKSWSGQCHVMLCWKPFKYRFRFVI